MDISSTNTSNEVSTPPYPQVIDQFLKEKGDGQVIPLTEAAVRIHIHLGADPWGRMLRVFRNRYNNLLITAHPGAPNQARRQKMLHAFEASYKTALSVQLASCRTAQHDTTIKQPNKHTVLNELPAIDETTCDLFNQIGDFQTAHGTATASVMSNASIHELLTDALRLSFSAVPVHLLFDGTQYTPEQRIAITTTMQTGVIVNGQNRVPKILTDDNAGKATMGQVIAREYLAYIDTIYGGIAGRPGMQFPHPEHIEMMFFNIRREIHEGRIPRQGVGAITDIEVANAMLEIVAQGQQAALPNAHVQTIISFFTMIGGKTAISHNAALQYVEARGYRVPQNLKLKDVYELLNRYVSIYNSRLAPELNAITTSRFVKYHPVEGGSAAVLVRAHFEDPLISIYRVPHGVTKAQRYFGFMIKTTARAEYNPVKMKSKAKTPLIRGNFIRRLSGNKN